MNRRVLLWFGLAAAVLLVVLIAGPSNTRPALDPRSTAGDGTKALVVLLRQLGATVDVSPDAPGPDVQVTAVLHDELSDARRRDLNAWVAAGGTVVVADPSSALQLSAPVRVGDGLVVRSHVEGPCPQGGFDDVNRLTIGASLFLSRPDGSVGCFPGGGDAFLLVSQPVGRGRFIGLGGAGLFTNTLLGRDDNSVLATDLFLTRPGVHVRVMLRSVVGGGGRSLGGLVGPSVKLALVQLLVAFGVLALWRGRRLGRPVLETQPVELAGSELVVAVGNLLARTGRRDAAADLLRAGLRRSLAERLGLPATAAPEELADAGAARTGTSRDCLLALTRDGPVVSDGDLVELAQSIERARREVTHG
jgi:hypothetical protein